MPKAAAIATVVFLSFAQARAHASHTEQDVKAKSDAASLYMTEGRFAEALPLWHRLFALTGTANYLGNAARCLEELGRDEEAAAVWKRFLLLAPENEKSKKSGQLRLEATEKRLREKKAAALPAAPTVPTSVTTLSSSRPTGSTTNPLHTAGVVAYGAAGAPLPPKSADDSNVLTRWWFWSIVGAAAVGVAVAATVSSRDGGANRSPALGIQKGF